MNAAAPRTKADSVKHEPIAHVRFDRDNLATVHPLDGHLRDVAGMAGEFAEVFGNADWGQTAGIWHDLGKYKGDFQEYIRKVTGYERDEAEEGGSGKDHALTAGERNSQLDPQFSNSLLEKVSGVLVLHGRRV